MSVFMTNRFSSKFIINYIYKLFSLIFFSVGMQSVSGRYVTYVTENNDTTNCKLRYNHISTNFGKVIQINSGHSKYNVDVNHIISSGKYNSTVQKNYGKSIGNVQVNFGAIGEQINFSRDSANIQINYVGNCERDYSIDNRFVICKKFDREIKLSHETELISYEITIVLCKHLSESTKKIKNKKIILKICVENYMFN